MHDPPGTQIKYVEPAFSVVAHRMDPGGRGVTLSVIGKNRSDTILDLFLLLCLSICLFIYFRLFTAAHAAHGGSQTRGGTGAAAANLYHSHGNARSELHQLTAPPDP